MTFQFHAPKSEDSIWEQGYAEYSDGETVIGIHRLVAVAEFGIEEVKGKEVHHKNECKYDNRVENLEVMSKKEHSILHNPPKHSKEECRTSLKRYQIENDRKPSYLRYRDWRKSFPDENMVASGHTIRNMFGCWDNAIEEVFGETNKSGFSAGYEGNYNNSGKGTTKRNSIDSFKKGIKKYVLEHGKRPTLVEYNQWRGEDMSNLIPYYNNFDCWSEAMDEILPC